MQRIVRRMAVLTLLAALVGLPAVSAAQAEGAAVRQVLLAEVKPGQSWLEELQKAGISRLVSNSLLVEVTPRAHRRTRTKIRASAQRRRGRWPNSTRVPAWRAC